VRLKALDRKRPAAKIAFRDVTYPRRLVILRQPDGSSHDRCCIECHGAETFLSSKTVALFPFRFGIVIHATLTMLVFRNIFRLRSDKSICPNCSSQEIYLSHRKNHFEKSLSVFLIRPFRCRQCHRRFWKFISPNSQMRDVKPSDLQKS
jgi:hypothetical protein